MKYYLIENEQQVGPFTLEEIKNKNITKETLIWTKGMDDWTEAKNIPDLKEILEEIPPSYKTSQRKNNIPPSPPSEYQKPMKEYFGYKLATRWERFMATIVEGLILIVPILIITKGEYIESDNYFSIYDIIVGIIVAVIIGGLMYPLWSGNLGHKIFGLKVISKENGEDVKNPISGIVRELGKSLLSYFILPIIWLLWDKDRQNVYDKISKTIVVKKNEG